MTALRTGDTVSEFELPDQTGTVRSLRSLLGDGPVVLFFYPAALTPDRTVLDVISSEINMDTHADKAVEVLRARRG